MKWIYDKETETFSIDNLTKAEMGITVAAIIAGVAAATGEPFGAEAARQNLINYMNDHPSDAARLLVMWMDADTYRIQHA